MDVSFIIPLYNCLPLTQAMLASLRENMPRERELKYEIIFVDDVSTDGTREWLGALASTEIRVVLNDTNLGYAAANNRGASMATGEYLVLVNNDVILSPGWLEQMLALIRADRSVGIVGNVQLNLKTGSIDHSGIFITAKGKPAHDRTVPSPWTRSKRVPACTGACLLISRNLWMDLRGFDEGFLNGGEDVDLCFRAKEQGRATAIAARSVIRHHISASPGRKRRDEANTRKLVVRWRDNLVWLGARAWCRDYLAHQLRSPEAARHPGRSMQILLHALGWTKTPPRAATLAMELAIDHEMARWDRMFANQG